MKSSLVIVYHRQPYEEVVVDGKTQYRENKSPNGIVPTLKSFFGAVSHGSWVAWKEAEDPDHPDFDKRVEISDQHGDYTVSRLGLTKEQVKQFYHVTSKEALWPILHSFPQNFKYDAVDWETFRDVNRRFAEAACEEARGRRADLEPRLQPVALARGMIRENEAQREDRVLPPTRPSLGGHLQHPAVAGGDRGQPAGLRHGRLPHPPLQPELRRRPRGRCGGVDDREHDPGRGHAEPVRDRVERARDGRGDRPRGPPHPAGRLPGRDQIRT